MTALVLTGASPALAGGGDHDKDDDLYAKVLEINDEGTTTRTTASTDRPT